MVRNYVKVRKGKKTFSYGGSPSFSKGTSSAKRVAKSIGSSTKEARKYLKRKKSK